MNYELLNFVQNKILLLFASIALILIAVVLHRICLSNLYNKLHSPNLRKKEFKMDQLEEVCSRPQGSNFNTMAIVSWNLLFLSIGFLFFFTPDIYGLGLMRVPQLASNPLGFFGFGVVLSLITFVLYIRLPKIYSFYEISKSLKMLIFYVVPLMLLVSIILSVHLGTIYPVQNEFVWDISYLFMMLGEGALIFPILNGAGGGLK
jgi:hypothetical protein